jgi:hypothetical protein
MHKPGFAGRHLIWTIAAASAATLALAASTASAAPASTRRCDTLTLVVWLDTQGNGAAGSIFYDLMLTNLSGRTCTLAGYPGVSAVNLTGRQFGKAARRNPQHTPRTITLADGASAKAVLQITDVANFPAATCRPVNAAGLRVYPPNQTTSKIVPFPFRACSRNGPVYLSVEAVQHA